MQSLHLPPMVSSLATFKPLVIVLAAISHTVSRAACASLQCHVSKATGHCFTCDTKTVGVSSIVLTTYRWPCCLVVIMMLPLADLTHALCSLNSTLMLLSASLDTEIKLDLSSGVCNKFLKVIFLLVPLTIVQILAFPFPITLKIESLPAAKPMVG